jgi:hypothetical protein
MAWLSCSLNPQMPSDFPNSSIPGRSIMRQHARKHDQQYKIFIPILVNLSLMIESLTPFGSFLFSTGLCSESLHGVVFVALSDSDIHHVCRTLFVTISCILNVIYCNDSWSHSLVTIVRLLHRMYLTCRRRRWQCLLPSLVQRYMLFQWHSKSAR